MPFILVLRKDEFIHILAKFVVFIRNKIHIEIYQVLVSVNPYRELPLYRPEYIKIYQDCEIFERPAHIFAIAEAAYRTLKQNSLNSCIVISGKISIYSLDRKLIDYIGESGSGKTEASKIILRYITAITKSEIQRYLRILCIQSLFREFQNQ